MNEKPFDESSTPSMPQSSNAGSDLPAEATGGTVRAEGVYLYSGPVPHPAILERLGTIDPEFPRRVFDIAEREQGHRHQLEQKRLDAAMADASAARRERQLGQWLGFAIMLGGLGVIVYAVAQRQPWVAAAVGGVYVLGLVFLGSDRVRAALAQRGRSEETR